MRGVKCVAASLCLVLLAPHSIWAQDLFIYPSQGQSQEQQSRDSYECHTWAAQQTGFDPTRSGAPPPSQQATEGGVLRGGARGATIGVVGGAIGGDAGKGAAIGAATGALVGGFRRRDQQRRQEQEQRNYAQAQSQQRGAYNRAMAACLQGRGYTVN
jgi:hypothetical protein